MPPKIIKEVRLVNSLVIREKYGKSFSKNSKALISLISNTEQFKCIKGYFNFI